MKKKKIIYIFITIIFVFLSYVIYNKIMNEKNKLNIILNNNKKIEINTKVKIHSFIKKLEHGKIITKNKEIDTTKLGNQIVKLKIENYKKKEIEYKFEIKIIDKTKPVIECNDKIEITEGDEVDLLKDVKVTDNSNEQITAKVEGEYDLKKAGTYQLKYTAEDSSHNKTIKEFQLIVNEKPAPQISNNEVLNNGVTYINGILIANKTYSLPPSYGNGLTYETMNAFNLMKNDALNNGISIYVASGFRSYYTQDILYNNYGRRDGYAAADTYSARPGHSEHQTGLGLDINTINDDSDNSVTTNWVLNNCYKYGFILRYPNGLSSETGYMYEWWHLRYVGNDLATILYNGGNWITLEKYLGITSIYN